MFRIADNNLENKRVTYYNHQKLPIFIIKATIEPSGVLVGFQPDLLPLRIADETAKASDYECFESPSIMYV